jgi:pilus assembly protein Flp/PilA
VADQANHSRHLSGQTQKESNMIEFLKLWLELKTDRRAVTALEYGLIAAVIAAVMILGATTLGTNLSGRFTTVAGSV